MRSAGFYVISVALAAALTFAAPVSAQQQQKMVLNFHDTDIRTFIEAVGEITGKTFIIDPAIKGTVTIVSANPVPVDIVYDIALHALRLQGVSAYKTGEAISIAPEVKARMGAREVLGGGDKPRGPHVITKVFPLQFAPTPLIAGALKPLMGQTAALSEFGMANTLVITDYADSIERLSSIIEKLDQPKRGALEVMKLKHIPAEDFVKLFESVYSYSTGTGSEAKSYAMIADQRTNSVILRTDNTVISGQIHAFAARVDVPVSESGGIRVVKLRYADPAKIAKILSGINANQDKAGQRGRTESVIVTPQPTGGSAGSPQPAGKGVEAASTVQSGIFVEEDTHSLVIAAPENEFNIYKTIIESLDIPRKQVYIEGLIAEVTTSKVAEFGIQWQSSRGLDANSAPSVLGVGGTNFGSATTSPMQIGSVTNSGSGAILTASSGLNIGVVNGTITLPNGTIIPNLLSLAHALETDSSTNIISTPTILALDSEEAKITVGQNVPIRTGSYASTGSSSSTGGTVNPFTTIERKDVGLELKIKTRIVGDDMVQLDVSSDINDLVAGSNTEQDGWRFTKRAVSSKIMVKDGKVIVIGGLMQDAYKNGSDKVPLLGDIPLIGALFRYDQKSREKTNLMVFLRPEIMATPDDAKSTVAEKYGAMIQKQGEQKEYWNPVLPTLGAPQMPPVEPARQQPVSNPAPAQPSAGKKEETAAPKTPVAGSAGVIRTPAETQKK